MIAFFKTLIPWAVSKMSDGFKPKTPAKKPVFIYMKRVSFVLALVLAAWALFWPESLALQLARAEDIIPAWFYKMLAVVFAGVWV